MCVLLLITNVRTLSTRSLVETALVELRLRGQAQVGGQSVHILRLLAEEFQDGAAQRRQQRQHLLLDLPEDLDDGRRAPEVAGLHESARDEAEEVLDEVVRLRDELFVCTWVSTRVEVESK